ncbi:YjgB family protein [Alicyclobacillus sendaiensis]|uniref:YjgB family protein n=1 Tax=Alicyclobacillus sendaiensis TaxID=192387 RepID=UPI0007854DD2|nr:YjgB family protein [Alicyclobacillus sendaiensis]
MKLWISMWTGAAQPKSANASLPPNPREVVQSVMQTALRGSLPGVPFSDGENIEQVMKAWGSPFAQGDGGAGVYVTYRDKGTALGLDQGDQIFDVRSYAPALQALTYEEIAAALGAPGSLAYPNPDIEDEIAPCGQMPLGILRYTASGGCPRTWR